MFKQFHCEFPNCSYECDSRSQIHRHHIIPKELNGTDDDYNLIWLCPNHHFHIFVENSSGIHKIKTKNSIVLKKWVISTGGKMLNYIDEEGIEKFI